MQNVAAGKAPPIAKSNDSDSNWALACWLWGLCWRYRSLFIWATVLQALLAVFGVLGLNLIGVGIDYLGSILDVTSGKVHWPLGLEPPSAWTPGTVIVLIALAAALAAVVNGFLQYAAARVVAELVHARLVPDLQRTLFGKLQEVCMRFYSRNSSGSVINRATGDIQAVRSFVDLALFEAITLLIVLIVYAGYMLRIHAPLTIACLSVAPAMAVASAVFSKRSRPLFQRYRDSFDRMILYLSETIRGAQVIKGFAIQERVIEKMRGMNRDLWDRQVAIFTSMSYFTPAINLINHFGIFILLVYGGYLVVRGELPIGTGLVVFAGLLQQYSNRISNVAQIANALQESLTGARRLKEVLETESSLALSPNPQAPKDFRGEVEFERVSVSFDGGRHALRDVSFSVKAGQMVALVGATGSGKSALLSLLPRLVDPDKGSVRIGGVDAREYDLAYLRQKIGVVFQESFLFSASVLDNIRFGREEADIDMVRRAAEIAQAYPFIEALPDGYSTVIGELGSDLSGGQRQRLSIARAVLDDPPILLLDDPTSAIDPETESQILSAMKRAMEGRTTFIVAHRLATLRKADLILLLDRGRLIQAGTHDEVLGRSELYRSIVAAQSLGGASERESLVSEPFLAR